MLSPAPSADRNLIFGLLALQMDFVTREQLLDAMHAWMLDKYTPLGEILRKRGSLNERRLALLEGLVEEHIAQHGGDAQASLASLHVEQAVRADFHRLEDADVHASLAALASASLHTTARRSGHGPSEDSSPGPATSAPIFPAPAGSRFRRLREHARGGLGEVFVALDSELNREVALKEIQVRFADLDDARARFVREAEITGNLEHPGVVPVYGLGAYGDGRPFYAMRFIRGESMQQAIDRFHETDQNPQRDPGQRSLALRDLLSRFVAVCNAVAYAHNRGVIHRDLKPANVMLGEYGETLVVDWGLARLLDRPDSDQTTVERAVAASTASGTAPTQMGQVIGTPSFIPPEQAEGRLDRMGIASDVFSLGATLYTLLTGQPPYQGRDVLGQARRAEVVPARQRKRSVPAALEAVCGKAMARLPEDRYSTARALAEDVQRWLADEPVRAYPEPLADRLRRWGRRNRSVVWAGIVLLAAGVVGLSVGLWAVGREQQRTKEAAHLAEQQKERAQRAEKETLEQYRASTDDAIEQLIGSKPVLGPQEKSYLERTLKRWQAFADRGGDDERSRAIRAEGHFRVALLRHRLGQTDDASAGYRAALTIREKLTDEFPAVPEYRKNLAYTHANLGVLLRPRGRYEESAEHSRKALAILQKLADDFPAVAEHRHDLAGIHTNLGALLVDQNQWDRAIEEYRQALAIQQKLADEYPDKPDYRKGLAGTHNNLGNLLKDQNEGAKAAEEYRKALAIREKLADAFPDVPDYRQDLAHTHANLGLILTGQDQPQKAAHHYRQALALQQKLAEKFPVVAVYRKDLANTHNNLGNLLEYQQQWEDASQQYHKALAIRQKLAEEFSSDPAYRKDLAATHNSLALLLQEQKQLQDSAEQHRQALAIYQKLADDFPAVHDYRRELGGSHNNLGLLLTIQNEETKAVEQFRKALAIRQKLVGDYPGVPGYQTDLGGTYGNYGRLLRRAGKPAESLPWFEKAIHTLAKVHQQDPRSVDPRLFLRNGHASRALAYDQLEKYAEAVKDWNRAIELSQPQEHPRLRADRANSQVRAGQVAEALAEVAALTKAGKWSAGRWYDFACIYAVAAGKDASRKKEYADRAMELLEKAVKAGYKDAAHMAKDRDLEVLRQREDFKKLMQSLAKPKE